MHNPDPTITDPDHQTTTETARAELAQIRTRIQHTEARIRELEETAYHLESRSWYAEDLRALLERTTAHLTEQQRDGWDYDRAGLVTDANELLARDHQDDTVTRLRTQLTAARVCIQAADTVTRILRDVFYDRVPNNDRRVAAVADGYDQARRIYQATLQHPPVTVVAVDENRGASQ